MGGRFRYGGAVSWLALSGLALVAACTRTIPPKVTPEDGNRLGAISFAYQQATEKLGRPPRTLADLRPYLEQVGDPEQLLISPRDGKAYVILWGVDLNAPFTTDLPVLAYEAQGAGGERMVLNLMGVTPLTEEEFVQLKLPRTEVAEADSNGAKP